jgi:hypothetical protein
MPLASAFPRWTRHFRRSRKRHPAGATAGWLALILLALVPASAEALLSRNQAAQIVINQCILPSPNVSQLVAYQYGRTGPDSLLQPGTVLSPYDSSFVTVVPMPTYFFWINDAPTTFFMHPTRFALVDAQSGFLNVQPARSWPLINGNDYLKFLEEGNGSPDRIWGMQPEGGVYYDFQPDAQPAANVGGIVIGGRNLHGVEDGRAIHNDAKRAKEILNKVARGPKIPADSVKCVGVSDSLMTGATRQAICDSIDAIPKGLEKLWVFLIGHGETNEFVIRRHAGDSGRMRYSEIAKKLLMTDAKEICVVIMSCFSGSALDDFAAAETGTGKNKRRLKGVLVTSSGAGKPTDRVPDGSKFLKALIACWSTLQADFDKNQKVTLLEALAWAAAQDSAVAARMPGGRILGDGSKVEFGTPTIREEMNATHSVGQLKYKLVSIQYVVKRKPPETSSRAIFCICNVSGAPNRLNKDLDVVFYDAKGDSIGVQRIKKVGFGVGKERCWYDVPFGAKSFKVRMAAGAPAIIPRAVAGDALGPSASPGRRSPGALSGSEMVSAGLSVLDWTNVYDPGEHLFHDLPLLAADDDSFVVGVAGPPGWDAGVDNPSFRFPAEVDTQVVFLTADVPDTATRGGWVSATVANVTSGDSLCVNLHALLHDSLGVPLAGGYGADHRYVEAYAGAAIGSGSARLTDSVFDFVESDSLVVEAGGHLALERSSVFSDSARAWNARVAGTVLWDHAAFVGAAAPLRLEGATGAVRGLAVLRSAGDGIRLSGNLASLILAGALVDSSASDGVVLHDVANGLLEGVRIENSGDDDVVMTGAGAVELRNSEYDAGKDSVAPGNVLTRSWDTAFEVRLVSGAGAPGVEFTVVNALGDTVCVDTTDVDGITPPRVHRQYVNDGGTVAAHTPHAVYLSVAGFDSAFAVTIDEEQIVTIVLEDSLVSGVPVGPRPPAFRLLPAAPNPFREATSIGFSLAAPGRARLSVFDVSGRRVADLADRNFEAGPHEVPWEGGAAAAGVYFVRLEAGGQVAVRKVLRLP